MSAITSKGRPQLAAQQQAVLPPNPTKEDILNALVAGKLDTSLAAQELAKIEKPRQSLRCKVSEKGAVSVYWLQRMPVTLYAGQWVHEFRHRDRDRETDRFRKTGRVYVQVPARPEFNPVKERIDTIFDNPEAKHQGEEPPALRQKMLLEGLECCAGQWDLFPTEKGGACESHRNDRE